MRLLRKSIERVGDFGRDERGAAAMIYVLTILVIMLLLGFALDMSRVQSKKVAIQSASDAAVIAGARMMENANATQAEVETFTREFFWSEVSTQDCNEPGISVDIVDGVVELLTDCDLEMVFGGFAQLDTVKVQELSRAKASTTKLDLALMLDVSGSMGGAKLTALQDSAKLAINSLITDQTGERVRVGVASYATAVNLGMQSEEVRGLAHGTGGGHHCVSERTSSKAFDDDEPQVGHWMGNSATTCPTSSVFPITSNVAALEAHIDSLTAGGATAGHLGVAWSWYLISPDWTSWWPAASAPRQYNQPDVFKAVVLMTDGMFNTEYDSGLGTSAEQALQLCENMRHLNVIVFAVAFEAPTAAETLLQNCTADPTRFFEAENSAELEAAYQSIASQLTNLALTE